MGCGQSTGLCHWPCRDRKSSPDKENHDNGGVELSNHQGGQGDNRYSSDLAQTNPSFEDNKYHVNAAAEDMMDVSESNVRVEHSDSAVEQDNTAAICKTTALIPIKPSAEKPSPVTTNRGLTASQIDFFRMLDEKIEQGYVPSPEESQKSIVEASVSHTSCYVRDVDSDNKLLPEQRQVNIVHKGGGEGGGEPQLNNSGINVHKLELDATDLPEVHMSGEKVTGQTPRLSYQGDSVSSSLKVNPQGVNSVQALS